MAYEKGQIGNEILRAVRNELYMNLPYLDVPLCSLGIREDAGATLGMATDGMELVYNERWLKDRYLRSRRWVNRGYLHVILHCILRHIWKARGKDPVLWDIACDAAVEALLAELDYDCLAVGRYPLREIFLRECAGAMRVITAEGVYLHLLRKKGLTEEDKKSLWKTFHVDDHDYWTPRSRKQEQERQEQDERWEKISRQTQQNQGRGMTESGNGKAVIEQLNVELRDNVDYRSFLRRFAAPKEVMKADPDSFDYIFYTYGLQLYGNMPLVEPRETREEKRIEDLIIAVDTSMSTNGDLVKAFLSCTYSILHSTETYTRKVNIHIIQCDNRVEADDAIHDLDDLKEYMSHFTLKGGHGTDFRPVFEYADEMVRRGEFRNLRGLIYFTDGMGHYPKKRPAYETAFVYLGKAPELFPAPPWAIRLELDLPDLYRAAEDDEELEDLIQWDDLPDM